MKVGIIVYSQTGNTLSVAENLKEKLITLGHKVNLRKIEVVDKTIPRKDPFKLEIEPSVEDFDMIIFGSLTEAFSLSPVTMRYLNNIKSLKDKRVACFVTQFFPFPWLGGNRAVKQMQTACKEKGAMIVETGVVNWSSKQRVTMIDNVVEKISKASMISKKE